jgi:hypothetical protein
MFILLLIGTLAAAYFAKEAYDNYKIEWAMFWSVLLGWDLHVILTGL